MIENPIEEIKRKIDIVDFISSFITLKKTGRNFKALCPFHQEKTPSFIVSPERQIWHCFGACNEGGDIFKFLMKWENITFVEALQELAKKTGVSLKKIPLEDFVWRKKERLFSLNELSADFFHYLLAKSNVGKRAREYLKKRNVDLKIIEKFRLGYAPDSWDSLFKYLLKKNYLFDEIKDSGLVVTSGKRVHDRFHGRLMFPIFDIRNQIIGFSGRLLTQKKDEGKYINTPETLLYRKRETLYGINLAKEAIKKNDEVILVEGEFDMITPFSMGIENIVATKGTAVTKEQLMLLKRLTKKIILSLDSDLAGLEAARRVVRESENLDVELNVVVLDFAKDPDEAVRVNLSRFKRLLKKPTTIYDFFIDLAFKNNPEDNAFSRKKIVEEVADLVDNIRNPIVRGYYIKKLASIVGLSEKTIEQYFRQRRLQENRKKNLILITSIKKQKREIILEKYLLSQLFQTEEKKTLLDKIFLVLEEKDFLVPVHFKILKAVDEYLKNTSGENQEIDIKNFVKNLDSSLVPVFDEIYLYADYQTEAQFLLGQVLYEIKKYSLKRQIGQLLKSDDDSKKEEKIKQLNDSLTQIEKKLVKLTV